MNHPFRALRHRDFRLFVLGQGAGILGYWIQLLAVHWLIYRLTGSALLLGVTVFAAQIPVLLLGPIAGALADRVDRYRAFVVVQTLELLQAVAMATLAYLGVIEPWHMIALTAFLGVTIAIELPVRHAYLPELLEDRADLPNAVAVTSLIGSAGRLVGPSVAGVMIATFSEASCFALNAASFLIVLGTLAAIRRTPHRPVARPHPMWTELREGALYAWRSRPIRALLLVLATVAFMATPYLPLMPAFVAQAFHGGPETLGFLLAGAGFGALVGTLYLSTRSGVEGLARLIAVAALCAGCALVAFATTRWYPLSLVLMAATGFGILAVTVSVNMILQAGVEDRMRGRIMSLYTAAFLGVAPLGGLVAGAVADRIGAAHTLLLGGACCALAGLALARARVQLVAETGAATAEPSATHE
jgi:MFS family permease